MLTLVVAVALLSALALLATRCGADSRDGRDHQPLAVGGPLRLRRAPASVRLRRRTQDGRRRRQDGDRDG